MGCFPKEENWECLGGFLVCFFSAVIEGSALELAVICQVQLLGL